MRINDMKELWSWLESEDNYEHELLNYEFFKHEFIDDSIVFSVFLENGSKAKAFTVKDNTIIATADPKGLVVEAPEVLKYCTFIKRVKFEENAKTIRERSFFQFSGLTSVEFNEGLEEIGNSAFSHCENLREVKLPETLRVLGMSAFVGCSSIEEVKFPKNLHELGIFTFQGCCLLSEVTMVGNFMELRSWYFKDCFKLRSVSLETNGNLKCIASKAFERCEVLEVVKGLESVVMVMDNAFNSCETLRELHLPSVVLMDQGAIDHCDALELLEVSKDFELLSLENVVNCAFLSLKVSFHGTGLTMSIEECVSLLKEVKLLKTRPVTVYEALQLLHPEELTVSVYETSAKEEGEGDEDLKGLEEETSLF